MKRTEAECWFVCNDITAARPASEKSSSAPLTLLDIDALADERSSMSIPSSSLDVTVQYVTQQLLLHNND